MKTNSALSYTKEELNALIYNETSQVTIKRCKRHVSLHPSALRNVKSAVLEFLNTIVKKFDYLLDGIMLGYKKVKIMKDLGTIFNDDSHVHIDFEADYYVFAPIIGCKLKGIVNKKGHDYISCLVHKVFHVVLPCPHNVNMEEWQGNAVDIGQEITFSVEYLELTSRLPYIRGILLDLGAKQMLNNEDDSSVDIKRKKSKKNAKKACVDIDDDITEDSIAIKQGKRAREVDDDDDFHIKKKTKSKSKIASEGCKIDANGCQSVKQEKDWKGTSKSEVSELSSEIGEMLNHSTKGKKCKKNKEMNLGAETLGITDYSHKDKKHKKIKRENSMEERASKDVQHVLDFEEVEAESEFRNNDINFQVDDLLPTTSKKKNLAENVNNENNKKIDLVDSVSLDVSDMYPTKHKKRKKKSEKHTAEDMDCKLLTKEIIEDVPLTVGSSEVSSKKMKKKKKERHSSPIGEKQLECNKSSGKGNYSLISLLKPSDLPSLNIKGKELEGNAEEQLTELTGIHSLKAKKNKKEKDKFPDKYPFHDASTQEGKVTSSSVVSDDVPSSNTDENKSIYIGSKITKTDSKHAGNVKNTEHTTLPCVKDIQERLSHKVEKLEKKLQGTDNMQHVSNIDKKNEMAKIGKNLFAKNYNNKGESSSYSVSETQDDNGEMPKKEKAKTHTCSENSKSDDRQVISKKKSSKLDIENNTENDSHKKIKGEMKDGEEYLNQVRASLLNDVLLSLNMKKRKGKCKVDAKKKEKTKLKSSSVSKNDKQDVTEKESTSEKKLSKKKASEKRNNSLPAILDSIVQNPIKGILKTCTKVPTTKEGIRLSVSPDKKKVLNPGTLSSDGDVNENFDVLESSSNYKKMDCQFEDILRDVLSHKRHKKKASNIPHNKVNTHTTSENEDGNGVTANPGMSLKKSVKSPSSVPRLQDLVSPTTRRKEVSFMDDVHENLDLSLHKHSKQKRSPNQSEIENHGVNKNDAYLRSISNSEVAIVNTSLQSSKKSRSPKRKDAGKSPESLEPQNCKDVAKKSNNVDTINTPMGKCRLPPTGSLQTSTPVSASNKEDSFHAPDLTAIFETLRSPINIESKLPSKSADTNSLEMSSTPNRVKSPSKSKKSKKETKLDSSESSKKGEESAETLANRLLDAYLKKMG